MKAGRLHPSGPLTTRPYTVATIPVATGENEGAIIFVRDGDAGSPCLAVSDGSAWKVSALAATISDGG